MPAAGGPGWTDERVELLTKLWKDGLSASQIAKRLGGITRNAALGKLSRLGLLGRPKASRPERVSRPRAPRVAAAPPPRYVAQAPAQEEAVVIDFAPTEPGSHACKWPIGDPRVQGFGFCGKPAHRHYCPAHLELAYQAPKPKPRKPVQRREHWGEGFARFSDL